MLGVYFSGTGNTKYCIEKFVEQFGGDAISIEEQSVAQSILKHKDIVFAYPVYYSNLPKIVRDFIIRNKNIWCGKHIFVIATMGLFSGDGAGLAARLFRKYDAYITGGLHLKMPDCIGDVKTLKKNLEENRKIIKRAEDKIKRTANEIKRGKRKRDGLGEIDHLAGFFGQRLYFRQHTAKYTDKLKIDKEKCIGCGKCAALCPMHNLEIEGKICHTKGCCTMCYRCISNCSQKAITLLGDTVYEQCKIENYIGEGK